jgi:hypothetical protein
MGRGIAHLKGPAMSWHTNAILIKRDYSDDYDGLLEKLALKGGVAESVVSFEDASSGSNEGVAVGTVDGWTVLFGTYVLLTVDSDVVAKIAKKCEIFQMNLEGASGTAGFTWWAGGKVVRDWMCQDGEVVTNEGKPLPAEKKAFAKKDSEEGVLEMLMALTVPWKKLLATEFRMYAFPDFFTFE